MKRALIYITLLFLSGLFIACEEKEIMEVDTSYNALNILKGEINDVEYPESYYFNAYFLGTGSGDYHLKIPVRLSGVIDEENDRLYGVRANPDSSQNVVIGEHYTLASEQIFHKGFTEDSIVLIIHISALDEIHNYRIYLELVPNEQFGTGVKEYSFIVVDFMKNVNDAPPFWTNDNKLSKFTYHPKKCVKFLEISKITDPEWKDPGNSVIMDYWINLATEWFLENEEYDELGSRIYFDQ